MNRLALNPSTRIVEAWYDPERLVLRLQFVKGGLYEYSRIQQDIVDGLSETTEVGEYFDTNIKGAFTYERIG